ncbi:hypothetical transmembrane protein coupled to NADH-ubiquinone oxidoreductase chain 5 homolog [Aquitalea magnusonii]|uniref:Probable inorganic carbon transporter subunit DabA n=1 Tax=Aquitalea magnusonii TaxID=332411 RepID=A0A3G9GIT6_9NEIS|nr:putative inorganic carbon transporter subunit DabA [Aquitalea magnusonii]BBF85306.1 hypothetical transmembrane protein coupled to NADH-ubiquinone oxidoreductase chain 5 homolog [Aquitalea magnusonii]
MTSANPAWQAAASSAASRIAPSWPLDSLLASSPYWGLRQQSFQQAHYTLHSLAGSRLHLDEADYRRQYAAGQISLADLAAALQEAGSGQTPAQWLQQGDATPAAAPARLLQSNWRQDAAGHAGLQNWQQVITQQVSQCCAAWFDHDQAEWQPDRHGGLYQNWLAEMALQPPPSPDATERQRLRHAIAALPADHHALFQHVLPRLEAKPHWLSDWFYVLLQRNSGWAAWCRYQQWQAGLAGSDSSLPEELLAMQLAWEYLLDNGERGADSHWQHWHAAWDAQVAAAPGNARGLIWQRAAELARHGPLLAQLAAQPAAPAMAGSDIHAVFCIDVRSEPMRRALEQALPGASSAGFAGFFGLPLAIRFAGEDHSQPRLPGLLAPSWEAIMPPLEKGLQEWGAFQRAPLSSFTLVESAGLGKAGKLLHKAFPGKRRATLAELDPWLNDKDKAMVSAGRQLNTDDIVALVEKLLPAMGLAHGFPATVLLVGHASHSSNNPQASALQCGACGGHGGHLHVLLLSDWLQRPAVRKGLAARGWTIPASTVFLPVLHLTHSDELQVLQAEGQSALQQQRGQQLQPLLEQVASLARSRRAGQDDMPPTIGADRLLALLRQKGHHWAETRPEWGLAGNHCFIAAPRSRSAALDLQGRAFLQEYHWQQDPQGSQLAAIFGGPLVVAHWINMQYFAAVADPARYGSGNKLLHNVVGGRIGVFEGNSGDLRIGLSMQSVHDGKQWRHAPLRLAACIDAPAALIAQALQQQAEVATLVQQRWLHLYRFAETGMEYWSNGNWQAATLPAHP